MPCVPASSRPPGASFRTGRTRPALARFRPDRSLLHLPYRYTEEEVWTSAA